MADLKDDLCHMQLDLETIHDALEHLGSHSDLCRTLMKGSVAREARELFGHLDEIDRLVHEVQSHLANLSHAINALNAPRTPAEGTDAETLTDLGIDIDDLKHVAWHTLGDLKDIHDRIEHLRTHGLACRDLVEPTEHVASELSEVTDHVNDLDEMIHDLIAHSSHIRGDLASQYSEFIWQIPPVDDAYLSPSTLLDIDAPLLRSTALKLADQRNDAYEAICLIVGYVIHAVPPPQRRGSATAEDEGEDEAAPSLGPRAQPGTRNDQVPASRVLERMRGDHLDRTLLVAALARSILIPSRVCVATVNISQLVDGENLTEECRDLVRAPGSSVGTLVRPEVYLDDRWQSATSLWYRRAHYRFNIEYCRELGLVIKATELLAPMKWHPITDLFTDLTWTSDTQVGTQLRSGAFHPLPRALAKRVYGDQFYYGP